ncbi:hypothetical protein CVT25_000115 [Psilocybe cyanescens]|uniref:Uncharacterized protein n=1 Tax=Psilocybe cyanescens TaxID=93625 RepID=A0A409XQH1_PSICY|nr:hypothetical protein CVT25_000115 [Psilocybe cyanescens]
MGTRCAMDFQDPVPFSCISTVGWLSVSYWACMSSTSTSSLLLPRRGTTAINSHRFNLPIRLLRNPTNNPPQIQSYTRITLAPSQIPNTSTALTTSGIRGGAQKRVAMTVCITSMYGLWVVQRQ